jgi:coenzyme F420-dependent glucose-6-phosphate dehydrogenase
MENKMIKLGYAISSEEHHPNEIIHHAQRAEEVGFTSALISDHYHP